MYKVRPLMDMLISNFKKIGYFHKNLSIDELMIEYFVKHSAKQFMKGKPVRFGYKNWMLVSSSGYCYDFDVYCGKNENEKRTMPLGAKVVLDFVSKIPNPSPYNVYFDNYFTTHSLMKVLKDLNIKATGTLRENRKLKCPLDSNKVFKNKPRGTFNYR